MKALEELEEINMYNLLYNKLICVSANLAFTGGCILSDDENMFVDGKSWRQDNSKEIEELNYVMTKLKSLGNDNCL